MVAKWIAHSVGRSVGMTAALMVPMSVALSSRVMVVWKVFDWAGHLAEM